MFSELWSKTISLDAQLQNADYYYRFEECTLFYCDILWASDYTSSHRAPVSDRPFITELIHGALRQTGLSE